MLSIKTSLLASLFLIMAAFTSCVRHKSNIIVSPDKMFMISFKKLEPNGSVDEWDNVFQYRFDNKWHKSTKYELSTTYYCDSDEKKQYYDDLMRNEYSEWNPGFLPIRIDQVTLDNGTTIYLVYALTYADRAYHDYYYSYTALCIKEGHIWRYPLFVEHACVQEFESNIVIIDPASIGLDFTLHPVCYEYKIDQIIASLSEDRRIIFVPKTNDIIIGEGICIRITGISAYKE